MFLTKLFKTNLLTHASNCVDHPNKRQTVTILLSEKISPKLADCKQKLRLSKETHPSFLGQLADPGHGELLLLDGELSPLAAQPDDRVTGDSGQN